MSRKTITIPENLHRDLNEQREALDMTWPEFLKHLATDDTPINEVPVEVTIDDEQVVESVLQRVAEDGLFTVNVEAEDVASEVVSELDAGLDEREVARRVSEQVTDDVRSTVEHTLEGAIGRGR